MPGRRINRTQVAKYMEHRKQCEQEGAAAKVGISVRSARRIERAGGLPSQQETRQWRTRVDPLSAWWASDTRNWCDRSWQRPWSGSGPGFD